jgi:hypothetical protein
VVIALKTGIVATLATCVIAIVLSACGPHQDTTASKIADNQQCSYVWQHHAAHIKRDQKLRGRAPFTEDELNMLASVCREWLQPDPYSDSASTYSLSLATDSLDSIQPPESFLERLSTARMIVKAYHGEQIGCHATVTLHSWLGADSALVRCENSCRGEHDVGSWSEQEVLAVRSGNTWKLCYGVMGISSLDHPVRNQPDNVAIARPRRHA